MSLCLLSVIAGAAVSPWAPAVQFALGLVLTAAAGAFAALACGAPWGPTLACTALLFALVQVGYVLGVVGLALIHTHRDSGEAKREVATTAHETSSK